MDTEHLANVDARNFGSRSGDIGKTQDDAFVAATAVRLVVSLGLERQNAHSIGQRPSLEKRDLGREERGNLVAAGAAARGLALNTEHAQRRVDRGRQCQRSPRENL